MRLSPRAVPTIAALILVALFVRLGVWQWHRYSGSLERSALIRTAWNLPPVSAATGDPVALANRRASLAGQWTDGAPVLVSGGLLSGQPGYDVIETFQQLDGNRLLVDRGWVPVGISRLELEALHRSGPTSVEGLLVAISGSTDLQPVLGADGIVRWPLETNLLWGLFPRVVGLPFAAIAAHAREPVLKVVLLLGPHLNGERERKLGVLPAEGYVLPLPQTHHLSYAVQWFAFAVGTIALWVWASLKAGEKAHE